MNEPIRIVTDSSSDLTPAMQQAYGIPVVPLNVHFGTMSYPDDELSVEAFWEQAGNPYYPMTSQPSIGAFEQVFEGLVGEGNQVLCVTLTSQHSGTFNAARLAAERFGGAVTLFDSLSLSLGLGVQALEAARAARAGLAIPEIVSMLEGLRDRMRLLIVLDTLEYLRHGGRAAAFMAVADRMTRVLNIKLVINLVDGQLRLLGPARSYENALRRVLSLVEDMGPLEHLAVAHTRRPDTAQQMVGRLAQRTGFPQDRILMIETGAVLGSHAGPGVIGVVAAPASSGT